MWQRPARHAGEKLETRFRVLFVLFGIAFFAILLRLGYLQIMQHGLYSLYASDLHDLQKKLLPTRGQILLRDKVDGVLHPLATNRLSWLIYAVPRDMKDPVANAHALSLALGMNDAELVTRLTHKPNDQYEPIAKDANSDQVETLQKLNLDGVAFVKTQARMYPEKGVGGQLVGFVSDDATGVVKGRYGLESSYEKELAGVPGSLMAETDAGGRRLIFGQTDIREAVDGSNLILTIDRTIQYKACEIALNAKNHHQADRTSIVVMDPQTGAILAMCSAPDFDPSDFGKVSDVGVLNNPVTYGAYEPGSVFKAITMAAGLDADKILPKTTYVDTGEEKIDDFTIHNSDKKAHGLQTMIQVLDESLNTGTIFVQRQLGKDLFRSYIERFGFGERTEIGLTPESKGNISSLEKKGSIFAATGSFGQGITMTPIQLLSAYGALANGGKLMRPYVVDEIVHPDGTHDRTKPQELKRPISSRASHLVTGMLISVVENGHGKKAGVPGYWVAGKTGTAQVPKTSGLGYQTDNTIGSFAGYAPATDPRFVMLVKVDHPRDVQWAESSAAPVFGEMAKFLLTYLQVPPERSMTPVKPVSQPVVASPAPSSTQP